MCRINPHRNPNLFIHSYLGIEILIRNKEWDRIRRATNLWLHNRCRNVLDCGKIIVVVNEALHWTFYTIFVKEKVIGYYDSFNGKSQPDTLPVHLLYKWLEYEHEDLGIQFNVAEWNFVFVPVQKQFNGKDCGFHLLKNVLFVAMDLPMLDLKVNCDVGTITFKIIP